MAQKRAAVSNMQQRQSKPLSTAILLSFFQGDDAAKTAEKVAQIEGSRIQYLVRHFEASDVSTVKEAVKGLKEQAEKEHGAKSPAHKTAGVRASEVQSLYGAWRFGGLKPLEVKGGYHRIVEVARDTLKEKAIKWTGERIPENWERETRKRVEQESRVLLASEMEREAFKRAHNGDEPTAEQVAEYRAKAADALKKAGAVQMARKLYEKQGAEFCQWLIEALEGAIAAGEQEKQEQTPQEQKAA